MLLYIYTYIYIHTHTYIYIYMTEDIRNYVDRDENGYI